MQGNKIYLIGYASGVAGADSHAGDGPLVIQNSSYFHQLTNQGYSFQWDEMIRTSQAKTAVDEVISHSCQHLARKVSELTKKNHTFSVIGGDHTCAIGTWSGVYDAIHSKGDLGLIWIDAHMDSHTPETSESGRIHGMPMACLLGYGYSSLTHILHDEPKIKPHNVCLIGVRSFEKGEAELLNRLNVRIYYMDEVNERGFSTVLNEAVKQVSAHTAGFGITIDIDGIDPLDAPGVDVPEPNGIRANDLFNGMSEIMNNDKLIATEIVEFDPSRDKNNMTEKVIVSLLEIIHKNKKA